MQAPLKGFMSYPSDLGREGQNIWLKFCWFFSILFPVLWVTLHDKTGQTRSLVLLCMERSSIPDHLQGDVFAGGCHPRKFLVLFSPWQVFEWWHFRKYGTSFIEQVSVSHLRPLIGGAENSPPAPAAFSAGENEASRQNMPGDSWWVPGAFLKLQGGFFMALACKKWTKPASYKVVCW